MKVVGLTVGAVQENTYLVVNEDTKEAVLIDPGEEAERIQETIVELDLKIAAILITHCHFDHIGAVTPMAQSTGAEVWVPRIERPILEDIMAFVPWEGFGPYESYVAEHDVSGGERLELAGFAIDVMFTPGHSPGHVTYSFAEEKAIFSGDVLFAGSIGRADLPGADMMTLMSSINRLIETLPGDTVVYPGHMQPTTLDQERTTNPFLHDLR